MVPCIAEEDSSPKHGNGWIECNTRPLQMTDGNILNVVVNDADSEYNNKKWDNSIQPGVNFCLEM